MLQIMKDMLAVLAESFETYSGNNWIWILYVVSLPVIFFLGKKEDRKLFLGTLLVECLTVFNPFFMKIAIEKFGFENRYARFFWMLVFYITIAYAMVLIVFAMKKRWLRFIVGIVCIGAIVFIGKPVFYGEDVPAYTVVENHYFNSNYILTVGNIFHREGIENPKILYGGDLMMNYRQFDPTVISCIDRKVYDKTQSVSLEKFQKWKKCSDNIKLICRVYFYNDYSADTDAFYSSVKDEGVNYIVSASAELDEYLGNTEAVLFEETEISRIWKVI